MTDLLASLELYRHASAKRDIRPIATKKLRQRREARYRLETPLGTVILRRIGYADAQVTAFDLMAKDEKYKELSDRAQEYQQLVDMGVKLSPQQEAEYTKVGEALAPYEKYYQMLCFVRYEDDEELPQFDSIEEYDAFLAFLPADDLVKVMGVLSELLAPITGEIPDGELTLANELGIGISDNMTLENMSFEEAKVYAKAVGKKYETMSRSVG